MNRPTEQAAPPLLLTVAETCTRLRVSPWTLYRLIHSGQLQTVRFGRRRLIPTSAVNELISRTQESD